MTLAATLARLPYDFKVEIRSKTGSAVYGDPAGALLEADGKTIRLDEVGMLTHDVCDAVDPDDTPHPPHLPPSP